MTLPRINQERLWSALMEFAAIGATPDGGSRRLALSDEDRAARDLFCQQAQAAGCTITIDAIGNIFARRAGSSADAAPVVIGSHLDTVPTGGRFDGVYGVLAGLEVIRCLDDLAITTTAPIEVAVWTNEEGARFSPMTLGACVFTGVLSLDFALSRTDAGGISVAEALTATGYAGPAKVGERAFAAYLELHVEQGPVLKDSGHRIGIVNGSYKALYFVATVTGEAAHVGPTPMDRRHDALAAAAALVLEVERIGRSRGEAGRSNAPHVELFPNVRGVIPAEVRLSCDVRHPDAAEARAMEQDLRAACQVIEKERGVTITLEQYFEFGPINPDPALQQLVAETADALGYSRRNILTVASHDAVLLMDHCPGVLFFVPSETGISHNATEYSTPEQCADGADVLLNTVLRLAGGTPQL